MNNYRAEFTYLKRFITYRLKFMTKIYKNDAELNFQTTQEVGYENVEQMKYDYN